MPNTNCCLCSKRIPSNQKKNRVGQPAFWEEFKKFVGSRWPGFHKNDHVCRRCHIKIRHNLMEGREAASIFRSPESSVPKVSVDEYSESELSRMLPSEKLAPEEMYTQEMSMFGDSQMLSPELPNRVLSDSEIHVSIQTVPSQAMSRVSSQASSSSQRSTRRITGIKSYVSTQNCCFICKSKRSRTRVPKTAIKHEWYTNQLFIPFQNRCCRSHIQDGQFTDEALAMIEPAKNGLLISDDELEGWIMDLTADATKKHLPLDFSSKELRSENYDILLGISKDNFETVLKDIQGKVKNSSNRNTRNALALFLMKLRLNIPQKVLAILFGIENQSTVSDTIEAVSAALEETFVPKSLGNGHTSRESAIRDHGRPFFNTLFNIPDGSLFLILDGTYLFIQKPGDFAFQKKTWSAHKHRNLVKPMMIVLASGYVIAAPGPYFADGRNNDAGILNSLLKPQEPLSEYVEKDDCFIVDRGFRDSIKKIRDHGLKSMMPKLLKKSEKQFTTEDANETRKVTMVRWIVEAVNGRIKNKFKFFEDIIPNSYLPKLSRFFKIAVALINAFSPPLFEETDRHQEIAQKALARCRMNNELKKKISRLGLDRGRKNWEVADAESATTFPILTLEDLKELTLGIYQLGLAKRYSDRHVDEDSGYKIMLHKATPTILRAKIKSRFSTLQKHNVWIEFDERELALESIIGYYCTCEVGGRTVGCCSHIASVLWYLSYHRHQPPNTKAPRPRAFDFIEDAAELIADESSDEESDDED